jgi:hypothetical protein
MTYKNLVFLKIQDGFIRDALILCDAKFKKSQTGAPV